MGAVGRWQEIGGMPHRDNNHRQDGRSQEGPCDDDANPAAQHDWPLIEFESEIRP